jgi:hypothetical protein
VCLIRGMNCLSNTYWLDEQHGGCLIRDMNSLSNTYWIDEQHGGCLIRGMHSLSNAHWLDEQHGGCLMRDMNCLPFVSTLVHLWFLVGLALLTFLVFFVVLFFILIVFVMCLLNPMLSVSLIAPSFFSNVYLEENRERLPICSHCGSHLLTFFHRKTFL